MLIAEVMTTYPDRGSAAEFAREIVEGGLAACVQIIPISSVYLWKGNVEEEGEHLLLIKTREEHIREIEEALRESHPYDVPQFLVNKGMEGSVDYVEWLESSTSSGE